MMYFHCAHSCICELILDGLLQYFHMLLEILRRPSLMLAVDVCWIRSETHMYQRTLSTKAMMLSNLNKTVVHEKPDFGL